VTRGGKIGRGEPIGNLRRFFGVSPLKSPNLFGIPGSTRGKTMAEIHDQFDTILILDFGSQVRSQLIPVLKDLMKGSTVWPQQRSTAT